MSQPTPENQNHPIETNDAAQEPLIPPQVLLLLAGAGFLVALVVLLTQPTFGVVGYGGLAFGVLALLAWALLAPQQARAVLTGRTARFGGTSVVVTIIFLVALAAIYTVVQGQNIRVDLTERDTYSLTEESRAAIAGIGADPTIPQVKILAFYGATQAGLRDRDSLLFDDYAQTSQGKITYEFIDPDRNPQQAGLYGVTRSGQIAVVALDENGVPDSENAVLVNFVDQAQLTNAILRVAASGEFHAYFLTVQDNLSADMSLLKQNLVNRFDWTVEDVSLAQLTAPQSRFRLNDPSLDGQVVVIPGGSRPLADQELAIIRDYLENGGELIVMAGTNLNLEGTSLASAENFSAMLMELFGVQFNNDVVIDQTQAFQTPLLPVATDLDSVSFITTNGIPTGQGALIFEVPQSISIAEQLPPDVIVRPLVRSTDAAYATTDLQRVLSGDIAQRDDDATGPFVLAASIENTQTGARVVLFGSTSVASDSYTLFQNIDNLSVAFNSLIWATNFDSYFNQINIQPRQRPQDAPLFADTQTLRNITFVTVGLLPFGILAIGIAVWWVNRERIRTH